MLKKSLNEKWEFRVGGSSMSELRQTKNMTKLVHLPHDASIEMERNADDISGSGNGYYPEKNYVYSKNFTLLQEQKGSSVWVEFEGIYQNAFVYVNHSYAGKCPYGYSNFYLDITSYVSFERENTITVQVRNEVPSGRWYTGGGIYRNVYLMVADRMHIVPEGARLSTIELDQEQAKIRVDTEIAHTGIGTRQVTLISELIDAEGNAVALETSNFSVFERTQNVYRQYLYVDEPKTWDDKHPYLYEYRVRLVENEQIIDDDRGTFGIRKLQLDPKRGLRVNGRTVKLRGGCIHHDNGVIGAAEFPYAAEHRIKKLKEAGYNAIRSSHYPMSRALLKACDKYGMYVMDEYSDVWTSSKVNFDYSLHMSEWWKHDITNMVKKDYNHPCVIMYSIGNEIGEAGNQIDVQWGKKLADQIRLWDDTRYITNGLNTFLCIKDHIGEYMKMMAAKKPTGQENSKVQEAAQGEINSVMSNMAQLLEQLNSSEFAGKMLEEAASQIDVMGYNYATVRYEMDRIGYPNRIIVGTETNGRDLDKNWDLVEKYPQIIGDFTWTAWDYIGEAGIGKIAYEGTESANFEFYAPYPCRLAYCGDFNIIGDRRPISYWREIVWGLRQTPYIAVQPPEFYGYKKKISQWTMSDAVRSWNYAGYEGKPIVVEIYSDADEVELLINDKKVAFGKVGKEKKNMLLFDIIYEAGKLEAIAYKDGIETGRDILRTASDDVMIQTDAENWQLPADGSDIRYIDVSLVDKNGVLNPERIKKVSIEAEGADLIGFGSGAPESEENYFDACASCFEGRLRAVIRGNGTKGEINITFKAEGCRSVTVKMVSN